ncbi:hypothetical protein PMAYCL1PPCAC_21271, partial [Pristionchus mayeri]
MSIVHELRYTTYNNSSSGIVMEAPNLFALGCRLRNDILKLSKGRTGCITFEYSFGERRGGQELNESAINQIRGYLGNEIRKAVINSEVFLTFSKILKDVRCKALEVRICDL